MPNLNEAKQIVLNNIPGGKIKKSIIYKDLFVFQVFVDDPLEGEFDPFYSVNQKTGEFKGFPLFMPGVFNEVMGLFSEAKGD